MWKVTRRGLMANKLRFILTGIAVILGVAFIAGTNVLTATIQNTFDDLFADIYRNTDAVVRAKEVLEADFGEGQRPPIPASLLEKIEATPGVAAVNGNVQIEYAQVVGKDGKEVGNPGQGPPTLGFGWGQSPELSPFRIAEGREPRSNDEIAIDRNTVEKAKLRVGDEVTILTNEPPRKYRLVGIAKFGEADSLAGASATLFTMEEAQRIGGVPDKFNEIAVSAEEGVSQDKLQANLQQSLASQKDLEVLTGKEITKENQDAVQQQLGFINIALLVFALVALGVGAFIIYNTFSIVVAQRTREMALLRAVGASRRQVLAQVIGEAFVVGLIASLVGVGVGILLAIGLRAAMAAFGLDLPGSGVVVPPNAFVIGILTGLVVTLLSAIVPARQASRVPPIAALRDVAIERPPRRVLRFSIGGGAFLLGVLCLYVGLFTSVDNGIRYVGLGALLIFIGAFVLGPLFARSTSLLIGAPLRRIKGITGQLARENAARNPKRTATTATALVIGIALVGFITIFAASATASINSAIDNQFKSDFVVQAGSGFGGAGLSPALGESMRQLPEIETLSPVRFGDAGIEGKRVFLNGADTKAATQLFTFGDVEGSWADLTDDGIAISERKADEQGWTLGQTLNVTFVKTGSVPMKVQYIFKENTFGDFNISLGAFEKNFEQSQQLDFLIFARLKPGVTAEEGRAAIEPLLKPYPTAELRDNKQYKEDQAAQVNQIVMLVYVLLALALIIALIGVANTLALSIHERTREIGLLRAVGMSRSQVRSAIRWEAVIISLLGAANGLAIGLIFGWSVVRALRDEGFSDFAVAPAQLLIVVLVLVFFSIVAAIYPARRAAKLDVLRAISSE
jgi:putative ABC transport system permease protein